MILQGALRLSLALDDLRRLRFISRGMPSPKIETKCVFVTTL